MAFNLTVNATGTGTLTYQWQRQIAGNGGWANVTDTSIYSGSATAMLSVNAALLPMEGDEFQCVVNDFSGNTTTSPTAQLTVVPYVTTVLAGSSGNIGHADGLGANATFFGPDGVAFDSTTGNIYVADQNNHTIRRITPGGNVTTYAGAPGDADWVDGPAATARFNGPNGIVVDSHGNVFVADQGNDVIRKITTDGNVSTFAGDGNFAWVDGVGGNASFGFPSGLAVDSADNLYIADVLNEVIRKITPAGVVTTVAGQPGVSGGKNGAVADALFNNPSAVAVDAHGNIYVSDSGNNAIRKISPIGLVSTLVGWAGGYADGRGNNVRLQDPQGLAVDNAGNVYVSEPDYGVVIIVTPNGQATTLYNANQTANPYGVALDGQGNIYFSEGGSNVIWKAQPALTPIIVSPPVDSNVGAGSEATFSISAVGAGNLTYQWQGSTNGGSSWGSLSDGTTYSGAFTNSLTINAVTSTMSNNQFRCIASNAFSNTTSTAAILTVDHVAPPVILPAGRQINAGTIVTFTLTCDTPGATITYSIDDPANVTTPYTGPFNATIGDDKVYAQATAPGLSQSSVSQAVFSTVVAPDIDFQPSSQSATPGSSIGVGVGITTNTFHPIYQWYQGVSGDTSSPIAGATDSFYQSPALTQNTSYWVRVGNGVNYTDSNTAIITVLPQVDTPVASIPAGNFVTGATENITLSCDSPGSSIFYAIGSSNFTAYAGGTISISTNTTLSINATAPGMLASQTGGGVYAFYSAAPTLAATHSNYAQTTNFGYTMQFYQFANNATTYQWYEGLSGDTSNPVPRATAHNFFPPPVLTSTNYWMRAANPVGSVDSPTFTAAEYDTPVVAWGGNDYIGFFGGQSNTPADLTDVVAISAGNAVSMALKSNGTIEWWGWDYGLEFPDYLTNFTAISLNNSNELGLLSDGTVVPNDIVGIAPLGLANVTAIAAGRYFDLALQSDGTVVGWGDNTFGQSHIPDDLGPAVAIAAGDFHSLALRNDGTVVAWGNNTYGQCDVPANLTNVVAIAGGFSFSLALKSDGTLVTWGANTESDNFDVLGPSAIPVGLANVTAISAQASTAMALKSDGTVVTWGDFDGITNQTPPELGVLTFSAIAAGANHRLALLANAPPSLGAQPAPVFAATGQSATLFINAQGATSYQWYQGQSGDTSHPVGVTNLPWLNIASLTQSANYWVRVGNTSGHTDSTTTAAILLPLTFANWAAQLGLSGANAQPTAYSFGDALPNLARYAMNLGSSSSAANIPTPALQMVNGQLCVSVQYRLRKGLTDYQAIPESSPNLQNWTAVSSAYVTVLPDDDIETARYEVDVPVLATGCLFVRIQVIPSS